MRYGSLIGILFLASVMQGKDVKVHQSGTLLQMDSVECRLAENSGKTFAGEILGTDSAHKKTHALLCQEYVAFPVPPNLIYRLTWWTFIAWTNPVNPRSSTWRHR